MTEQTRNYFKNSFDDKKVDAIKASIILFKAIPIFGNCSVSNKNISQRNNIKYGFMFSKKAEQYCSKYITNKEIIDIVKNEYGYDVGEELNNGFYKNFNTVLTSTKLELYINQIMHYLTTYGMQDETEGRYKENTVYIPNDKINISSNIKPVKITIIDALTLEEIQDKILTFINSGIALNSKALNYISDIIKYFKFDIDIDQVKNKEIKVILCNLLNLIPKNPVEFLRYMIYSVTNNTLLIKNKIVFNMIKSYLNTDNGLNKKIVQNFKMYIDEPDGMQKLASIFLRYKPLFLAFKSSKSPELNNIINKIRKLADKYHEPLKPQILNSLSSNINILSNDVENELESITNFKKISLINGLLYRLELPDYIMYNIRNGKSFVTDFPTITEDYLINYERYIDIIYKSLIKNIAPKIKGKKIYIPDDFVYMAPVSEKKFFGHIPFGSYYKFKSQNVVVGVHWFNVLTNEDEELNTDLDLRLQSINRDIGWDNYISISENESYSQYSQCIFSGDMTTAPRNSGGAMEAYYVSENFKNEFATLTLHFYNLRDIQFYHIEATAVPFKLVLDDAVNDRIINGKLTRDAIINPSTLAFSMPFEISDNKLTIGFLDSGNEGEKKFYFYGTKVGKGIVSSNDQLTVEMLDYTKRYLNSCLTLKDILTKAGAVFEKEENEEWDINLDPYKVTKDQLIDLFI